MYLGAVCTAKNTVISPNILVWRLCGKEQFPHTAIHLKLCGNCSFPENFYTRKLGEITVFFAVFVTLVTSIGTEIRRSWVRVARETDFISRIEKP